MPEPMGPDGEYSPANIMRKSFRYAGLDEAQLARLTSCYSTLLSELSKAAAADAVRCKDESIGGVVSMGWHRASNASRWLDDLRFSMQHGTLRSAG